MFDKFLCKHIQKEEICFGDILNWAVKTTGFRITVWALVIAFMLYSAFDLYYNVHLCDTLLEPRLINLLEMASLGIGVSVLIANILYYVPVCIVNVSNIKVAHCPLKKDK